MRSAPVGPAVLGGLVLACVLRPVAPAAHTVLVAASPAPRTTVARPPGRVVLTFSERLEPAYSAVSVWRVRGGRVDGGDARVGPDARSIAVSLPLAPPGAYVVRYRVVSVDGHVTEGDFTFTVGPGGGP